VTHELELVSTDALVSELMSRFDHAVLVGLLDWDEDTQRIHRRWKGDTHTCVGLAADMERVMLVDYRRSERKTR
jgi:hypothetical protein